MKGDRTEGAKDLQGGVGRRIIDDLEGIILFVIRKDRTAFLAYGQSLLLPECLLLSHTTLSAAAHRVRSGHMVIYAHGSLKRRTIEKGCYPIK
jgi:hypothetical protein